MTEITADYCRQRAREELRAAARATCPAAASTHRERAGEYIGRVRELRSPRKASQIVHRGGSGPSDLRIALICDRTDDKGRPGMARPPSVHRDREQDAAIADWLVIERSWRLSWEIQAACWSGMIEALRRDRHAPPCTPPNGQLVIPEPLAQDDEHCLFA